jgi:hypothetical protein
MIKPPTAKTLLPEYDRQLTQACPWLNGKEVGLTTTATALEQKLPHGLGRAYRGGWQVSTTNSLLIVLDPALQDDADVNVTVIDALAGAGSTKLWVY